MKLSQLKQQIEELDAKATKGPWKSQINHAPYKAVVIDEVEYYTTLELKPDDGDFIALSRTALPELLRRLLVAEEALLNSESALHWALDKTPSPCRCVSFSEPPHVCIAHKAIDEATAALATIRGE